MTFGTTVDDLCERVRRDSNLGVYGPVYSLASPVLANATSLPLNEMIDHITMGSIVAVDAELYRVTEVLPESQTINVVPGAYGTTSAAHGQDVLVEQDPRIPKASLIDWAGHEILSWQQKLFRIRTLFLPVVVRERAYDTGLTPADTVYFLLEVRRQPTQVALTQSLNNLWTWTADNWPRVEARLLRDMPLTDFPSGLALQLTNFVTASSNLRVAYATNFNLTAFDLTTDLIADVGLQVDWLEILELGMRWRAYSHSTFARTDWRASGINRNAEEVTSLDLVRAAGQARDDRDRRLADAMLALRSQYPYGSI